jgi:flagellar biosynthesis/type III secretory pathway M-ring protein FliF/YscJ
VKIAPVIEAVVEPEPEPEPELEDPAIVAAREATELERMRMEQEKERIAKLEKDYEELSAYTIEYVKNNPQVIATLLKSWRAPKRDEDVAQSNFPINGMKPEGSA